MQTVELVGQPAEVRMTLQIKRAATGKVETHELTGQVVSVEPKEESDGNDTQHSSPQRRD